MTLLRLTLNPFLLSHLVILLIERIENLNHTYYRDQINKVANVVKEIITAIKKHNQEDGEIPKEVLKAKPEHRKNLRPKIIISSLLVLALIVLGYFFIPKLS